MPLVRQASLPTVFFLINYQTWLLLIVARPTFFFMADVIFPPPIKLNRLPLESSGQTGHGELCRGYRHQLSSGPVHEIDRPCALKNISPAFFLSFFLPIIECMRTQLEEKFPSSLIDWLCFYVKIGINPRAFFFFGRGAGNVVGYGPPVSIYSARFGGCWQIPIVLCPPLSLSLSSLEEAGSLFSLLRGFCPFHPIDRPASSCCCLLPFPPPLWIGSRVHQSAYTQGPPVAPFLSAHSRGSSSRPTLRPETLSSELLPSRRWRRPHCTAHSAFHTTPWRASVMRRSIICLYYTQRVGKKGKKGVATNIFGNGFTLETRPG